MFEEWHDRIHFLGVPDDRRTKVFLGVTCTVCHLQVLYLNDMCRSVPLLVFCCHHPSFLLNDYCMLVKPRSSDLSYSHSL